MKKVLLSIMTAGMLMIGQSAFAQVKFPSPSTKQVVTQQFGTASVELSYSRPSVKNRTIFGALVPYNKIWRTGANAPTTLEFGQDVIIMGKAIAKGKYGLLTIPGEDSWTIIITKDLNVTSEGAYKEENDVIKFSTPVYKLNDLRETFTIEFNNVTDNSMRVDLIWEKTNVFFEIKCDYDAELTAAIEKSMEDGTGNYFSSAAYFYNNNKDMKKALDWVLKADEQNPGKYWVQTLKAKIQYENGLVNEAMETAEIALEGATKGANAGSIDDLNTLIGKIKADSKFDAKKYSKYLKSKKKK